MPVCRGITDDETDDYIGSQSNAHGPASGETEAGVGLEQRELRVAQLELLLSNLVVEFRGLQGEVKGLRRALEVAQEWQLAHIMVHGKLAPVGDSHVSIRSTMGGQQVGARPSEPTAILTLQGGMFASEISQSPSGGNAAEAAGGVNTTKLHDTP